MSERFILNSETLHDLISNDMLKLLEQPQRGSGTNYFFIPNIALRLYNPKITWIDPYKKHMSFSFNKFDNIHLYTLLKHINTSLSTFYKKTAYNPTHYIHSFMYEKGNYFYIKCYLPNTNGKYQINSFFDSVEESFVIPKLNYTFDSVIIDIKNIWKKDNQAGFNLELKETYIKTT